MIMPFRSAIFCITAMALITPLPAAEKGQKDPADQQLAERVQRFLRTPSPAGVRAEEARELGKEAVPFLEKSLTKRVDKSYHPKAITALGFIGDAGARRSLMTYMDSSRGPVGPSGFEGLLNAPMALGHLAVDDDEALRFLLDRADVAYWAGTKDEGAQGNEAVFIVRAIMNGLGLSGRPEALRKLEALKSNRWFQECAEDNIQLNRAIAGSGGDADSSSSIPRLVCGRGSLSSAAPEDGEVVQPLTVARHAAISVDPLKVTKSLEDASKRLHDADSPADVACDVKLELQGSIGVFGNPGDKDQVVQCSSQLRRVLCQPDARIKLVKRISGHDLCETQGDGSFSGCAEEPGRNILLAATVESGAVWAHEFGHNQGLGHRSGSLRAIMHPTASGTNEVDTGECSGFRRPQ